MMAQLPALEEFQVHIAAERLKFLEHFAMRAGDLVASLAPTSDRALPAEAALIEAAGLAFATGRTSAGKELLARMRSGSGAGEMSLLRQVTIAAILNIGEIHLGLDGVLAGGGSEDALRPWAAPATIIQSSAGALLAAALASGPSLLQLRLLSRSTPFSDEGRLAQLAIATCAEVAVLPLFGILQGDDGLLSRKEASGDEKEAAFASFVALHNRYAAAIRLNRADRYRWSQLRCRAPLIDWPLLLIHLALRRHTSMKYRINARRSDLAGRLAIFLQVLAAEIDHDDGTSGGSRSERGGPGGPGSRGYDQPLHQTSTTRLRGRASARS